MIETIAVKKWITSVDDKEKWSYYLSHALSELENKARGRVLWGTLEIHTETDEITEQTLGSQEVDEMFMKFLICRVNVEVEASE